MTNITYIPPRNNKAKSIKIEDIDNNFQSNEVEGALKELVENLKNNGVVTDEQVNTAVDNYLTNNPIDIGDLWGDISDGEIFEVTLPRQQTGIAATFTQGSTTIYTTTLLDNLKSILAVKKIYDDNTTETITNYTLSGTLVVGTSIVTVTSGAYTTTFTVTVSETPTATLSGISSVFTQGSTIIYPSTSLDALKTMLVVTALYNDSSSVIINGYTLSGVLAVGTSTITVTYEGKETTFNVIVTKENGYVTNGLAGYYDLTQYADGYAGDIADLSGNNMPMKLSPHKSDGTYIDTYNPINVDRVGFVGGKFMCNRFKNNGDGINVFRLGLKIANNTAFTNYPFTVEIYAHLRINYTVSGDLIYDTSTRYTSTFLGTMINTQQMPLAGSGHGLQFQILDNSVNVNGSAAAPNVSASSISNLQVDGNVDGVQDTNLYHHFVVCFGASTQSVYMDGLKILEGNGTSIAISSSLRDLILFGNTNGSNLCGDVKLVRIYKNKFLTQEEVVQNYNDVISTIGGAS